jgi:hypothetical protein
MAYHDEDKQPAQEMAPREQQEETLDNRLKEAEAHIAEAERMVRDWEPVRRSCRAGLEALNDEPKMAAVAR